MSSPVGWSSGAGPGIHQIGFGWPESGEKIHTTFNPPYEPWPLAWAVETRMPWPWLRRLWLWEKLEAEPETRPSPWPDRQPLSHPAAHNRV